MHTVTPPPPVSDNLWFGRICVAKLVQFHIFCGCQTLSRVDKEWLSNLIWVHGLPYFQLFHCHHRALAYVCWIYLFAKSAATPRLGNNGSDHAEWYISSDFHHYSFIDVNPALPCKLQPERLAVIYWNLYVVLKCYIEKWTDVPETIQIYILQCWATHM